MSTSANATPATAKRAPKRPLRYTPHPATATYLHHGAGAGSSTPSSSTSTTSEASTVPLYGQLSPMPDMPAFDVEPDEHVSQSAIDRLTSLRGTPQHVDPTEELNDGFGLPPIPHQSEHDDVLAIPRSQDIIKHTVDLTQEKEQVDNITMDFKSAGMPIVSLRQRRRLHRFLDKWVAQCYLEIDSFYAEEMEEDDMIDNDV